MENINNQSEKDLMMETIQKKIKEAVNPYYLSDIEKIIKDSLNPQISQSEVSKI
jgi:hypothetical protein